MKDLFQNFGIIGIVLQWLFGKMLNDADGQTLSSNRLFALITGIYGLYVKDYVLVGIGVGQFVSKTVIDALKKEP